MTDFSDFKAQIIDYANRQDWTDSLIVGFIRQAEQKFNAELRCDRMISTAINLTTDGCAQLPDDWLESDFMLIAGNTPTGWFPIHYRDRDSFFSQPNTSPWGVYAPRIDSTIGYYTIEGRTLYFGGQIDPTNGTNFKLSYYAEVPVFADLVTSWIYTKYPALYLYAALMHADLHAVGEEDKAAHLKQLAEDMIQKLNMQHRYAKASGSRISHSSRRSFG